MLAAVAAADEPTVLGLFPAAQVWTTTVDSALVAPPAFDAHRVYLPLTDGRLMARELRTGHEAWTTPFAAAVAPVAGDDLVFAASADAITAFRSTDGAAAWSTPAAGLADALVWRSGWLLATSREGVVRAFRAADGVQLWRRDLGTPPGAALSIIGDRVYVPAEDGRVIALAIETGDEIWEHRLDGAARQVAALDDRLYVGSVDNNLYCLDAADGRERWRWRTGGDIVGAPAVDDRGLYFASLDNLLRALDPRSGRQRWKRGLDLRPTAGPALADGTLVVSGFSPKLQAFSAVDGQPAGDFSASGDLSAPPYAGVVDGLPLPLLVVASGGAAQGTTLVAMMRTVEPRLLPVAPLPGLVPMGTAGR